MELLRADGRRVAVGTILQAADMEGLTGRVRLSNGEIGLLEGVVVGAARGDLRGRSALLELLLESTPGPIVLTDEPPEDPTPMGPGPTLLLEAARRADEWQRFAEHGFEVVRPSEEEEVASIESLLDGQTPLFEVVEVLGIPRHEAARVAASALADRRWIDRGKVRSMPEPDDGTSATELLERGRAMLRSGRIEEACAAFERAVRKEPDNRIAAQNLRIARSRLEAP